MAIETAKKKFHLIAWLKGKGKSGQIDDGFVTRADFEARLRNIHNALGFDLFGETSFQHGIAHSAYEAQPKLPRYGPSMSDAWSVFQSAIRNVRGPNSLQVVDQIVSEDILTHAVTFGSPHSNFVSRSSLGYALEAKDMELRPEPLTHGRARVVFGNGSEGDETQVERLGLLGYREANWTLEIENHKGEREIRTPRLNSDGQLLEDYLVVSNVPNMCSSETEACLRARAALKQLVNGPREERQTEAYQRERDRLVAASDDSRIKRVLIVGGLHGPGTSAARAVFGEDDALDRLVREVREHGLEGRSWQAVYKVGRVERKTVVDRIRDVPDLNSVDQIPQIFPFDN
jgi:hypothetical protein